MATARRLLVDPGSSGVFHCTSRCVRRAFLCGRDNYSGRDYEHRRGWIRDRLRELAGLYAVEIHSYSVMSNHVHVVVRTLPGRAAAWGLAPLAAAVSRPVGPAGAGQAAAGRGRGGARPVRDHEKLARCRARLANLSWFMRSLNEPIARRANREDECTGHFWEGRFDCQRLEDAGAVLACMVYVDLNPVRAGLAETPEDSAFTSAQDRAVACRARRQIERAPDQPSPEQARWIAGARATARRDAWLAPLGGGGSATGPDGADRPGAADGRRRDAPLRPPPSMSQLPTIDLERYLELLDWTGRQIRSDKRGSLSADLRPALERLELDVERWVANVEHFGGLFCRVAGTLRRLRAMAQATGRAWLRGHAGARRLYAVAC